MARGRKPKKEEFKWDVSIGEPIDFFDSTLSYEITGYRPIDGEHGLDFDPEWFLLARRTKESTHKYCSDPIGSKAYSEFWDEEYDRCRNGMTVNGYTITGDNYFFINYYQLPNLASAKKAGGGRSVDFPNFYVKQYEYFHYVEMCKVLRKNAIGLKARGVGFSEIAAAILINGYTTRPHFRGVVAAQLEGYVEDTLSKCWLQLSYLDDQTEDGMRWLRQVHNTAMWKRASNKNTEGVESGWMSEIEGIAADKPNKIRGDRTDILMYEESGCHIAGTLVLMYDGSFKNVENVQLDDLLMGDDGTSRKVVELHSGVLPMYKITLENGDTLIVNENHILYGKQYIYRKKEYKEFQIKIKDFYNTVKNNPRKQDGYKLIKSNKVKFPYKEVPLDPYLFGFWLGDGSSDAPRFTNLDEEIIKYLKDFARTHNMKYNENDCLNSKKCKHIYLGRGNNTSNYITDALRELNVLNNKHIPDCYIYNSDEVLLLLLAGFIDSDGTYNKSKHEVEITLSEKRKHIIDLLTTICHILGMRVSNSVRTSKDRKLNGTTIKGGVNQYRLRILYGHSRIPVKIERKKSEDRENRKKSSIDRNGYSFKIEPIESGLYFGFSLTGNLLFLLKDFTVCHNSWPNWKKAFIQGDALIDIQGLRFGIKLAWGTGREILKFCQHEEESSLKKSSKIGESCDANTEVSSVIAKGTETLLSVVGE